ncbi:hypothetical protein AX774_g2219 [Zancudomyces culisetae]|uniref:Uncharacterized protein n=1 Tax=Zancudomyces culisetae TaxID=1213189 RepID=A0A1R1PTP9_ZANCU|nr:hypothetical protein AX774_g2219 [Zancudomyces culisetae]|eukprot:OMH84262.1 hypothetical protein AX774_g2219 [Zancudomyces culisetae]
MLLNRIASFIRPCPAAPPAAAAALLPFPLPLPFTFPSTSSRFSIGVVTRTGSYGFSVHSIKYPGGKNVLNP